MTRFYLLLALSVLSGCANLASRESQESNSQLFAQAEKALHEQRYNDAESIYIQLLQRVPEPVLEAQSKLGLAYSSLQLNRSSQAISVAQGLVNHPDKKVDDYARYLLAAAVLKAPLNAAQGEQALLALDRIAASDSAFADSAHELAHTERTRQAVLELEAARYLLNEGDFAGAINRARFLIEHYAGVAQLQTSLVNDALNVMVRGYRQLGLEGLARSTEALME